MPKTLARRRRWASRLVTLVSLALAAALSVWLGVFVWRTEVTYHVGQTITVLNEGDVVQTPGLVAWVVPPTTASQRVSVAETSSPVEPAPGDAMMWAKVSDLAPIPPGGQAVYRLDLDITVTDGAADPSATGLDAPSTAPAPFLEAADPRIIAQAQQIVGDEPDQTIRARRIYDFVVGNIRNQGLGMGPSEEYTATQKGTPGASDGALWTLEHGYGVCGNFAALYAALCRAAGVPARIVGGWADPLPIPYLTRQGNWGAPLGAHAWSEVYLLGPQQTKGWLPVDAFWGQGLLPLREKYFLDLDNTHIALGDESLLRPAFFAVTERVRADGHFLAAVSGPYWYVVAGPPGARFTVTHT